MLIVTNPGSNLSETIIERYDIAITPQQVVVDGVLHDTREGVTQADVDRWVAEAKVHPHTLGTSAAEFVTFFRQAADSSRELLAVHTSRKIIQSHDACLAAAKTLRDLGRDPLEIEVVDSGVTDVGAGMVTLFAATAAQSGASLSDVAEWSRAFAARGHLAFIPASLDWAVKGGRTNFARAWIANLLKLRPLITMEDGDPKVAVKIRVDADWILTIANWFEAKLGTGRAVYAAVNHGGVRGDAAVLMHELEKRFNVRTRMIRPVGPAVYLHVGANCLGAYVAPIDELPFEAPSLGDIS